MLDREESFHGDMAASCGRVEGYCERYNKGSHAGSFLLAVGVLHEMGALREKSIKSP